MTRLFNICRLMVVGILVATAITAVGLLAIGVRYSIITTPSMGTYAPVGTLLVTAPTTLADVHVGQTVLFQPPGSTETYFHRVTAVKAEGLTTRGDINPTADPWTVRAVDVRGREVLRLPGIGWLMRAMPFMLIGWVFMFGYTRLLNRVWRFPVYLFGQGLLLAVANFAIQPWFRATLLSERVIHHVAHVTLVNTGALPILVRGDAGPAAQVALPGAPLTVLTKHLDDSGHFTINLLPHLSPMLYGVLAVLVILPLIASGAYLRYHRTRTETAGATDEVIADPVDEIVQPLPVVSPTPPAPAQAPVLPVIMPNLDEIYTRRMTRQPVSA